MCHKILSTRPKAHSVSITQFCGRKMSRKAPWDTGHAIYGSKRMVLDRHECASRSTKTVLVQSQLHASCLVWSHAGEIWFAGKIPHPGPFVALRLACRHAHNLKRTTLRLLPISVWRRPTPARSRYPKIEARMLFLSCVIKSLPQPHGTCREGFWEITLKDTRTVSCVLNIWGCESLLVHFTLQSSLGKRSRSLLAELHACDGIVDPPLDVK